MQYLIAHARSKKLDQVTVGYTVVAWIVIQAASIGASAFAWPAWALQTVIVVAVVGLPIVLIGAWTQGVRGEDGGLKPTRVDLHMLAVISVFLIVAGGLFVWTFWPRPAAQPPVEVAAATAPPNSVAVLPFVNTGGDPNQRYFGEGISEELIGRLARNPVLRVAARTSSFFFEGKNEDVRTIARKLNVRSVLEGSVRTENTHVRIEADLIDANTGFQLWTESYDRSLSDILLIQEDIARSIAQALVPALAGKHATASGPKPTQIDPAIYRDYLQAQFLFDQRLSEGQTPQSQQAVTMAVQLFRKVAAQAPDFADGQAALAYSLLVSAETGRGPNAEIQQALHRALALDPGNPQALTTAMDISVTNGDWDSVIEFAKRLKQSNGHSAAGAHGLAAAYENLGLTAAATEKYRENVRLDPFSYAAWAGVMRTYFEQARYQDVIAASAQASAFHPNDPVVKEYICTSLASLNRISEARVLLAALSQPGIPLPLAFHCRFFITLHSEGPKAAIALVDDALAHDPDITGGPGDTGFMLSHAPGGFDKAMDFYQKVFDSGSWPYYFYPGQTPPAAFFRNPRWIALTQRPEYKIWQAACERARRELLDQHS